MKNFDLVVHGIPDSVNDKLAGRCRSRLTTVVNDFLNEIEISEIEITISTPTLKENKTDNQQYKDATFQNDDIPISKRAEQYLAHEPSYKFDFLVLSEKTKEDVLTAVDLIKVEAKVFEEWNLKSIEPFPKTALNFYGQPGTGKTLAAHAIASYLNRKIIVASYAQIESKFHGDGPKNVEALFFAAERDNAILFIDEADSLLSKRLTNVTQGSEQAINSMRSQLLISLGLFKGIVVFATNLVENYDRAFETRVLNVYFPLPDKELREKIWKCHLPKELPLATDVSIEKLSEITDMCGRDIKNTIVNVAIKCALNKKTEITLEDLVSGTNRIKEAKISSIISDEGKLSTPEENYVVEQLNARLTQDNIDV